MYLMHFVRHKSV